jgi:hypothetical protein
MLPEQVVGMARNAWTASIGIDGRHSPDYTFIPILEKSRGEVTSPLRLSWNAASQDRRLPVVRLLMYNCRRGEVSELADERDLGSRASRRGGSNPPFPTR